MHHVALPRTVRTVVSISPQTMAESAKAARASGQTLGQWLAEAVRLSCSNVDNLRDAPWDRSSMELFAAVASAAPGLLSGPWRGLYDAVASEPSLWIAPAATEEEIEEGLAPFEPPVVDIEALGRRWGLLVAEHFAR